MSGCGSRGAQREICDDEAEDRRCAADDAEHEGGDEFAAADAVHDDDAMGDGAELGCAVGHDDADDVLALG